MLEDARIIEHGSEIALVPFAHFQRRKHIHIRRIKLEETRWYIALSTYALYSVASLAHLVRSLLCININSPVVHRTYIITASELTDEKQRKKPHVIALPVKEENCTFSLFGRMNDGTRPERNRD